MILLFLVKRRYSFSAFHYVAGKCFPAAVSLACATRIKLHPVLCCLCHVFCMEDEILIFCVFVFCFLRIKHPKTYEICNVVNFLLNSREWWKTLWKCDKQRIQQENRNKHSYFILKNHFFSSHLQRKKKSCFLTSVRSFHPKVGFNFL